VLVCSWKQFVLLLLETTCLGLKGNMPKCQNAMLMMPKCYVVLETICSGFICWKYRSVF
jgi:hypothetical protein